MKESSIEKKYDGHQTGTKSAVPSRHYKDRVFRMLFKEKEILLELYNALNGSTYTDTSDMTVTTLENAVYIGMKNDVSFVFQNQLMIYEHQSTENPNMSLRNLFYISDIYAGLTREANLFSSRKIQLPEPKAVVFYNGAKELPERQELRLSDSYTKASGDPALELKTLVLNINKGNNLELMEKSRTLREYMEYVDRVRTYSREMSFEEAVEKAVSTCIEEGILADFLLENRTEVMNVSIYEYDEAKHIALERQEAREEGRSEGRAEGRAEGKAEGIKQGIADALENLMENLHLTMEQAMDALGIPKEERKFYLK